MELVRKTMVRNFLMIFRIVLLVFLITSIFECKSETCFMNGVLWNYYIDGNEIVIGCNDSSPAIEIATEGSIEIPSTINSLPVTKIARGAFQGRRFVESIVIPSSVRIIGSGAFQDCIRLNSIVLSSGLESIGSNAFNGCLKLKNIAIPQSVKMIGANVFKGCSSLTFDRSTIVGVDLLDGWVVGFTNVETEILDLRNVQGICDSAFWWCSSLKNVYLPNKIERIGPSTFYSCRQLERIVIPIGVKQIESEAFAFCSALTEITISANVTNIAARAFEGCSSLQAFDVSEENSFFSDISNMLCNKEGTVLLCCPGGLESVVIPESVNVIGKSAFANCEKLKDIRMHGSINIIEDQAFYGCKSLSFIGMPDSVHTVGDYLFWYCSALESVRLAENLKTISVGMFDGCIALKEVVIPDKVERIGASSFSNCNGLANLVIGTSVKDIEHQAFYGCKKLHNVIIPNNVTNVSFRAFESCICLTNVVFGSGLESLENYCFENCESLISITFRGDKPSVDFYPLYNTSNTEMSGLKIYVYAKTRGWCNEDGVLPSKWAGGMLEFWGLESASVKLIGNDRFLYTGKRIEPKTFEVVYNGVFLIEGQDYIVQYGNNINVGRGEVAFVGSGRYEGTRNKLEFSISPRLLELESGSASKVYDGTALINNNVIVGGDGFVSGEGATFTVTGSQTSVGSSENTFAYTFKDGTKAENYIVATQMGLLTVTAASIGGGASGGEEPGNGIVPQGGLSKFDTTVMYDGKAHTIDTNALLAVTLAGSTPEFSYALTEDGPWQSMPFVYTNVCTTSFWYKISAENYQDYIHEARLTISPRTGVVVDIIGNVATNMFDNEQQSVSGYQVSINDPLYSESDFEFTGSDTVSKIAVGEYPMGLSATQFTNTNVNFTDVVFNVTDGELVILALPEKNVIFDALGGVLVAGESVVTQKCDAVYRVMPTPTREGYRFEGWYLGVTNAAPEAAEGAALLVNEEHTLFAKWGVDVSIMPGGESIFKWESVSLDTVRILGFKDSLQTVDTLVFPDTIEGKAVVEIATGAFANSKSGMRKVILSIFCTRIGDKAFNGISSLSEIKFANARQWSNPSCIAELDIGRYAFAGAGVCSLMLPASVAEIGDYVFANCKSLSAITILGQPAIGLVPFRRAGMNTDGIIVHLDPALANNSAYMDSLKQECASVTVRADAVVNSIELSSLSLAADEVSLLVSVEKAASWGSIDSSAIKVSFRASLSDEPIMLDPILVVENDDGSLTVKVASPGGESGFFQVVYLK